MAQGITTVTARATGTVLVQPVAVRPRQAAETACATRVPGAVPEVASPRARAVMVKPVLVPVGGGPRPVPAASGVVVAVAVGPGAAEAAAPARAVKVPPAAARRTATETPGGGCLGEAGLVPRSPVRRPVADALVLAGGATGVATPTVAQGPGRRPLATAGAPTPSASAAASRRARGPGHTETGTAATEVALGPAAVAGAIAPGRPRKATVDVAGRARKAMAATGRRPRALVGPAEAEGAGIARRRIDASGVVLPGRPPDLGDAATPVGRVVLAVPAARRRVPAEARSRPASPVAAAIAAVETIKATVLTTVVAARPFGSPGRRVVATARPVEVLVATLVERLPPGAATVVRLAGVPIPGGPRPRIAIAEGRARRVARGAMDPPGPGAALPRQARVAQVRSAPEARLVAIRRPTLGRLATVLDARNTLGVVAEGQPRGPTVVGRRPEGVPGLRQVPARAPTDPRVLEGARAGAGIAKGVGQVLALGATAVAVEVKATGATDPAALVQGAVAEEPPTGVAGLVGHA